MANYTFSRYDEHGSSTTVELQAETLPEVLEAFTDFLRGCSYTINYDQYLDLVSDEDDEDEEIFLSENEDAFVLDFDRSPAHAVFLDESSISLNETYGTTTTMMSSEK